jgi:flagellar basal-body rod protein FlgB
LHISDAHNLASQALDFRAVRAKMIAANIANIDTPNYKAKDISFEKLLVSEANKLKNSDENELSLATTNLQHMSYDSENSTKANFFLRATHSMRNDANSVDLDVETMQMSKNQIMFNAIISAMKKESTIFKSVIESSSKVS